MPGHIAAGGGVADGLAQEVGKAGAEDGEGQTGHVLVGPEGDGEDAVNEGAQSGAQDGAHHGDEHGHHRVGVGHGLLIVVGPGQTGHAAHEHHALHAQVQVARLLGDNLAQGAEEEGRARQHGGHHKAEDFIHCCAPPFRGKSAGNG